MRKEHEDFLKLLKLGLGGTWEASEWTDEVDWMAVRKVAESQGMTAVCWDGLQNGQFGIRLDDIEFLKWYGVVAREEQRYAKHLKVAGHLAKWYQQHGYEMMLMKGLSLSDYYPTPQHRRCGDIDIFVMKGADGESGVICAQEEADRLMASELGIKMDNSHHHHSVFDIDGVMVENHYNFVNIHSHYSNRRVEKTLQASLEEKTLQASLREKALQASLKGRMSQSGSGWLVPPVRFNAVFLLSHAGAHFAAERSTVRFAVDWGMFVKTQHDLIDWGWLESWAREMNRDRFLFCLNIICVKWLGLPVEWFGSTGMEMSVPARMADAERVLNEMLLSESSQELTRKGLLSNVWARTRRVWRNRWKFEMVYPDNFYLDFVVHAWSNVLKFDKRLLEKD